MNSVYADSSLRTGDSLNIRLVEVQPRSQPCDPISCRFHVVSLSKAPSYAALSYTWGDEADSHEIIVDGIPLTVRRNLWTALDQMVNELSQENITAPIQSQLYWIDAICIDQENISERNHQVKIMGNIYSNAALVIVWLGRDKHLEQTMRQLSREFQDRDMKPIPWSAEVLEAAELLFEQEYWYRLWIIHEYILAVKVEARCGSARISEQAITWYGAAITRSEDRPPELYYTLQPQIDFQERMEGIRGYEIPVYNLTQSTPLAFQSVHRHCQGALDVVKQREKFHLKTKTKERFSLPYLINITSVAACTDARDHVYGLLSLVDAAEMRAFPVEPDYSKSTNRLFEDLVDVFYMPDLLEGVILLYRFAEVLSVRLDLDDEFVTKTLEDCISRRRFSY